MAAFRPTAVLQPMVSDSFSAKSLFSMAMCKLLLLGSAAGFVLLAEEQSAIAAAPTAIDSRVEEAAEKRSRGSLLRRLWGYTPCPPIRPDCNRNTAVDIGDSLPGDFVVAKQTPYRTGRNEVLITSPSTGTEQRFEINLPDTGRFQLYKASFDKVKVSSPEKVLGAGASLSPQQVAAKLQRFEVEFEQNAPKTVVLADGTRGEFSAGGVVIRSKDGWVIETVGGSARRGRMQPRLMAAVPVGSDAVVAQAGGGSCQGSIRNELYEMSQAVQQKGADILKQKATSEEAKLIAWVTTFSRQALEDSLIPDNRNQTLQEVACAKPVQCNEPQSYNGGWETRTDLFKLPGGKNTLSLRYEFYQIPDSIELWREGNKITKIGPKSGSATIPISDPALNGSGYVGVKVIGNPTNQRTLWNYTISCSTTHIAQEAPKCDHAQQSQINKVFELARRKDSQKSMKLANLLAPTFFAIQQDGVFIAQSEPIPLPPPPKPKRRQNPLPKFAELDANYPNGDASEARSVIGGNVDSEANREDFSNTCTLRISHSFNLAPGKEHKIPFIRGKSDVSGEQGFWYFYRVKDFVNHLYSKYGEPSFQIFRDSQGRLDTSSLIGQKGVLVVEVSSWTDATGHVTLWDGRGCEDDKCYFDEADSASIWITE